MAARIAINGFGRIGRLVFRIIKNRGLNVDIVGINDLTNAATLAHLLKYDSSHGRFNGSVSVQDSVLTVNGDAITISAEKSIDALPWNNLDLVIEATGVFTKTDQLKGHLKHAKKVLLTAPAKDKIESTIVLGVNDNTLTGSEEIISNASCTTNCLAPMVKVLLDNFGIERGYMSTVHAYTNDQRILDLPHSDLRRARAAAVNIIPTSTGAAKALGLVIPEIQGKLDGLAYRVPVADGSLTDFTAILSKDVTTDEVNAAFKQAAETSLQGILEYSTDHLVSSDIVGNPHSCIFDSKLTNANGNLVKIVGWYDNEWGYSNRIVDVMSRVIG